MLSLRATSVLLCALALACAPTGPDTDDGYIQLPGDIDDAQLAGKGDAWDWRNDPARLAQSLNYRIDELPLSGRSEADVWAASYWPTYQGSTNYRWLGESTLSPLEKYDAAFHDWTPAEEYLTSVPDDCGEEANTAYTAYRESLGPAARWQAGAQGRDRMYDGQDNDDDDKVDECDWSDRDGIETWWGLCHAWAPASILEPEPLHAVEYNGQTFEVSDIKALLLTVYDSTRSRFLGGRCNDEEVEHDDDGRATADECRDVNPGSWHVVVTNFLGVNGQAFVEDRTGGYQVWNQPLLGYEITHQEEIDLATALSLLEQEEGVEAYPFNEQAVRFFEVRMTTDYVTESHQSTSPVGHDGYVRHDRYHYILEVDDRGKVIGGEWLGSSRDNHPDFLWVPTAADTSAWRRSNPNVQLADVRTILELSRRTEDPEDPVEPGKTFTSDAEVAIPDNDATGATSVIDVPEGFTVGDVSVTVDIEHTWRGDLRVELRHGGTTEVLHDRTGGSADDLNETFVVPGFAGLDARGGWELFVSDNAGADTGKIVRFSLTFLGEDEDPEDPEDPVDPGDSIVVASADVPKDIPDNDDGGVAVVLTVADEVDIETLAVDVDITHTYRGDLSVELIHGDTVVVLADREGGSADDLVRTFDVTDFAGESAAGGWTLRVRDRAAYDTGTIRAFTVRIN